MSESEQVSETDADVSETDQASETDADVSETQVDKLEVEVDELTAYEGSSVDHLRSVVPVSDAPTEATIRLPSATTWPMAGAECAIACSAPCGSRRPKHQHLYLLHVPASVPKGGWQALTAGSGKR